MFLSFVKLFLVCCCRPSVLLNLRVKLKFTLIVCKAVYKSNIIAYKLFFYCVSVNLLQDENY